MAFSLSNYSEKMLPAEDQQRSALQKKFWERKKIISNENSKEVQEEMKTQEWDEYAQNDAWTGVASTNNDLDMETG